MFIKLAFFLLFYFPFIYFLYIFASINTIYHVENKVVFGCCPLVIERERTNFNLKNIIQIFTNYAQETHLFMSNATVPNIHSGTEVRSL